MTEKLLTGTLSLNTNKLKYRDNCIQNFHSERKIQWYYSQIRPEFFYFSFYRPSRLNFLKIEKKIKDIFFNFIFVFSSDSCQYSTGVQLCFFVMSFLLQPG